MGVDDRLLDEGAVLAKDLDAIVDLSQTYTKPSFDTTAQCTVLNCFERAPVGLYAGTAASLGWLP